MPMKLYVGNLVFSTSSQELQRLFAEAGTGQVTEVQGAAFISDQEAYKQVDPYFTEIAKSRKRSRRLQVEIDRLKKKTQAIIDKLQ